MSRLSSLVFFLPLIMMVLPFKTIAQDNSVDAARTAIQVNSKEKDLVLLEMRIFLQSVQQITKGITEDDMDIVTSAARLSGRNAQAAVPASLARKLPSEFKKLGFDTHAKFDQLALDADQLGDGEHALDQLSTLLENCVSCHSLYRFQ